MNLNTQRAATAIAGGFFLTVTIMETLLFCSLFDSFAHWGRLVAIGTTVLVFNTLLSYFAIKYHQASTTLTHDTEEENERHTN